MTAADALRAAIFTLSVTADPAQAAQTLDVAAARGVDPGDLAQLRADWDALFAATVVRFGGAA